MPALIIGCGNADCGDAAAGPLVARRLRAMGIEAREESGEGLALMACWDMAEDAILVDAMATRAAPGSVRLWDLSSEPPPREAFPVSTHGFGVAAALDLARVLGRLPARTRIYGIEGHKFAPGAPPSPAVLEAVEQVAVRIAMEVTPCTNPA